MGNFLNTIVGNFVAHSVTIIATPGQAIRETICNIFFALIYPNSGLMRGLHAIFSMAIFERNSPKQAVRSGALCMVAREGSTEEEGPHARLWWLTDEQKRVLPTRAYQNIHVVCKEPEITRASFYRDHVERYDIVVLPRSSEVEPLNAGLDPSELQLTSNSTIAQGFASLFQTLFAVYTLYKSRGAQLTLYGYTAFALMVVPCAVMSVINFTGNIITPSYPKRYLVHTADMDEEIAQGWWKFEGTVGRLKSTPRQQRAEEEKLIENNADNNANMTADGPENGENTVPTQINPEEEIEPTEITRDAEEEKRE